jgi:hypothetical protein
MLMPMTIFLIFSQDPATVLPEPEYETNIGAWSNIDETFRLFLFVFLIVILTALATSILKKYKINYVYIFDINIRKNVTPLQLLSLAIIMLFIW